MSGRNGWGMVGVWLWVREVLVLLRLLSGEALRLPCRGCKPGLGPAADLLLLLRQEK